jgi:hypothetical protein
MPPKKWKPKVPDGNEGLPPMFAAMAMSKPIIRPRKVSPPPPKLSTEDVPKPQQDGLPSIFQNSGTSKPIVGVGNKKKWTPPTATKMKSAQLVETKKKPIVVEPPKPVVKQVEERPKPVVKKREETPKPVVQKKEEPPKPVVVVKKEEPPKPVVVVQKVKPKPAPVPVRKEKPAPMISISRKPKKEKEAPEEPKKKEADSLVDKPLATDPMEIIRLLRETTRDAESVSSHSTKPDTSDDERMQDMMEGFFEDSD